MSYTLQKLLWNNEGKSDKIWGWVEAGDNWFCFWGKRQVVDVDGLVGGKRPSLQFKMYIGKKGLSELEKLSRNKQKKGYTNQDITDVDAVVPGFTSFFENALVTARLMGKVRTDDWADC